ncbi:MAG: hypothetical protein AUK64_2206 [bacterium P201]|jgi:hypothetical protein|nr:MAG: hypothetical protein AUK64_2206 [bacterium P201]
MHTSTLILLLTGIIAVLVALVCFLVWRMARKDDELRLKNRVIVDEVERRHRVIDRAVKLGVNRAALLMTLSIIQINLNSYL